jgi:hypothetical protein
MTGGTTTATGGTTTAISSRVTGGTTTAMSSTMTRQNEGDGQHNNGKRFSDSDEDDQDEAR